MEGISQLVSDALARHGIRPSLDHLRLQWSRWFRCESSFSVLLAPAKPGIFALGEEVVSPAEGAKRLLALFQVSETDDLGMALGRLFLPGNPLREKLESAKCFARYTVVEDGTERKAAFAALQRWMNECGADTAVRAAARSVNSEPEPMVSELAPSLSFAWGAKFMEVPNQESATEIRPPGPLPSGF
ncbi:MAG TPA: hypothetical protein VFB00_06930 [Terriglobales bacterium]|nr:hypothetical protein [Terriglobales bacterium]